MDFMHIALMLLVNVLTLSLRGLCVSLLRRRS